MWTLESLGFGAPESAAFQPYAAEGYVAGRVAVAHRDQYVVYGDTGELWCELTGRLRHEAQGAADLPATGDWVVLRPRSGEARAVIHAVIPRRTCLSRKVAGATTRRQVVAANVDTVFLVSGLDGDFNPRRIERGLVLAWESGAAPVLVLNKADVCPDLPGRLAEAHDAAPGVPVHVLSCSRDEGIDALSVHLGRGQTVVLVGSSGVGKSTLTNRLLGVARQATREVRASDSRGRHTTTRRELIALPSGAWIIDTPGIRELQLWAGDDSAATVFDDVAGLAAACRFTDCRHAGEPGCAVREAISSGRLDQERFASFEKLLSLIHI